MQKLQDLVVRFIDGTHRLATGPNKYKSQLGRIAEGVFRRDYLTLETIILLSKKPKEQYTVYGNSCMDLSRRVFEDMVGLEHIALKGKDELSRKFMAFKDVEAMRDLNYLKESGMTIDPKFEADTVAKYNKTEKKHHFGNRRSWAGIGVEKMVLTLLSEGVIKEDEKRTLLQTYQAGCYKNHFSPTDIFSFLYNDLFEFTNKTDMELGLFLTFNSLVKIAKRLVEECEVDPKAKRVVEDIWQILQKAHETDALG